MTPACRRYLLSAVVLAGLLSMSCSQAVQGRGAMTVEEMLSRQILSLVFRARDDEVSRQILPYLVDLAEVYGPEGLAVGIIGNHRSDRLLIPLSGEILPADGPLLTAHRRDGAVLASMEKSALDLYAIYRICERELRGQRRVTLNEHIKQVIERRIEHAYRVELLEPGAGKDIELGDLLRSSPAGSLLVPPGCGACLLEKQAAALGRLFLDRDDLPVLVFDHDADLGLREFGWRGAGWLLSDDAESRLLSLRQAGNYQPVLVGMNEAGDIEIRPIRSGGGS